MGSRRLENSGSVTLSGRLNTAREVVLWLLGYRTRHRVVNVSMEPTASAGDFVLVNPRAYRDTRPAPGDIVIARHPFEIDQMITKRVANVDDTHIELTSDNPAAGNDSRHFGPVPAFLVRGQVTCVIR